MGWMPSSSAWGNLATEAANRIRALKSTVTAQADSRAAFDEWYQRNYPLSAEALRTGACDESIEESRGELALGFRAGWQARAAASQPAAGDAKPVVPQPQPTMRS